MLNDLSQQVKDKYCMVHLNVESKKAELTESRIVVVKGWGKGEMKNVGQRVQISIIKMKKLWVSNPLHCDYS